MSQLLAPRVGNPSAGNPPVICWFPAQFICYAKKRPSWRVIMSFYKHGCNEAWHLGEVNRPFTNDHTGCNSSCLKRMDILLKEHATQLSASFFIANWQLVVYPFCAKQPVTNIMHYEIYKNVRALTVFSSIYVSCWHLVRGIQEKNIFIKTTSNTLKRKSEMLSFGRRFHHWLH